MKKNIKNLKKLLKNNLTLILILIISLIISIFIFIKLGLIQAIIILILINGIYLFIRIINKKDKGLNKNQKKSKIKKRLKVFLLILLALFILGIIGIIGLFSYIVIKAPEFDENLLYVSEPSIILDRDGNEIEKLGNEKRIILTYDEIPEVLVDAIVATEDSRFFEHNGVDWARFIKATAYQLIGRSGAGGASTLTMQVSKNTYTSTEASGIEGIIRKFTDVYMSIFKIEKKYSKEQIMEFYVNTPFLGKNAHGVEQVSLSYFGKSTKELNVAEAAMIAGLFQAPGRYDPYKNPEATEKRRQTVLKLMLRHKYISKKEYDIAKKMTVDKIVVPKEESIYSKGMVSDYQSFIDVVVEEVKNKTGKNPYTTPMTIYTTMNTDYQKYINDIMYGRSYDWENDVVKAGVAVVNVKDGSIVAIGGNRNNDSIDNWNYATDSENQIGSTAKPLYDYGPAVEYMNWSPYQPVPDEQITYSDGHSINNWDGGFQGYESIRVALTGSRNIPALKTFKKNNKSNIIEFVTNLGLTPEIYSCEKGYKREKKLCINKEDPSDIKEAVKDSILHEAHAIGGYNGESPLSVSAAYAAFANGGIYTEPYSFTKVVFQDNGEEYINKVNKNKAMSEETAYIISDMLATTATHAMGRYYNINGMRYAAKTGTTNYDQKAMEAHNMPGQAVNDLWTVGFNTEYAIGVWYGYDNISNEFFNSISSQQNMRLFNAVGKKVFSNTSYFSRPSGVIEVEVESECPEPMLPSEFTPSNLRQTEIFIRGTEPTTTSQRFQKLKDVSNLKANAKNEKITITWDRVSEPEINTESYLKNYFSSIFENTNYLNEFVNNRLSYNKGNIGDIGYNIYLKDSDGKLKLLDFVSTNKYETKMDTTGDYTFVVKTAYSIFKPNMSSGKEVKVSIKVNSPIIPSEDESTIKPSDKEEEKEKEESDN